MEEGRGEGKDDSLRARERSGRERKSRAGKRGGRKKRLSEVLGRVSGGKNPIGVVLRPQSGIITRVPDEYRGKELISHLRTGAANTKGKRTVMRS